MTGSRDDSWCGNGRWDFNRRQGATPWSDLPAKSSISLRPFVRFREGHLWDDLGWCNE